MNSHPHAHPHTLYFQRRPIPRSKKKKGGIRLRRNVSSRRSRHIHRIWRIYRIPAATMHRRRIRRVWRSWRRRSIIRRLEDSAAEILVPSDIVHAPPLPPGLEYHHNNSTSPSSKRSSSLKSPKRGERFSIDMEDALDLFQTPRRDQEIVHRPHINVKRLTISIDV